MTEWIISSTVLMLIVIGLRAALKGRVSLGLQYALWLLVLVRLLVPVNVSESAMSILNAAERAMETPAMQTVTEFAEVRPEVRDYAEARAQVAAEYEAQGIALNSLTRQELREFDQQVDARRSADYTVGEAAAHLLGIVWIAGMVITAAALLMANLRFGLGLRRSRRELPVPGCDLPVYVTGAADTPCLFGLVKPAIYLPADTPWDEKAMEHILTHEQTHYRHGDHIWSVLRCVCLALHWYNPLVWVCGALSRRDGELACDEASIRSLGEDRRAEYGRTLIDMTCQKPRSMVGLTATTMHYSARSLRERVLLIARHPKTAAYTLVLVIAIAAIAVGCTFTGTPEETTEPTDPTEHATEEVTEEVTQEVTELPTEPQVELPTEAPDARMLEYQALFDWGSDLLYNRATGYAYADPLDVDLYYLFYNGVEYPGSWDDITSADRELLIREGFWTDMDIQIMPADMLEEKLLKYFSVGLGGVQIPEEWVYSSESDTYYSNHNDAYIHAVTVTGYTDQPDGTVVLHLIVDYALYEDEFIDNAPMYMTLRPVEDGYRILSNVFGYQNPLDVAATWRDPADIQVYPFTEEEIAEAAAVVEKLMEEFDYNFRIKHISFDPISTDHWVLANYAVDRLGGIPEDDYYQYVISMTAAYNGSTENESIYTGYQEIEFVLVRSGASEPWRYLHHNTPASYYPSLLVDPDAWNTLGSFVPGTVAVYQANDGVNNLWIYARDPETGEIRYLAR